MPKLALLALASHGDRQEQSDDSQMPTPSIQRADARVALYEPTLASIGAAVRLMARIGTRHPVALVQCSTRMRRYPLSPAHVRYALADRRPDAVIPFEPALLAGSTGKAADRPGKAYRKAMKQAMGLVGGGGPA